MTTWHEEWYSDRGCIHSHDKAVDEALDICFKSTTQLQTSLYNNYLLRSPQTNNVCFFQGYLHLI